jgi:chromosomal replication initiator protein
VDQAVDTVDEREALLQVGEAEELWNACTSSLRGQLPDAVWTTCFQPTTVVELTDDVLVVAVPSTLVKERIETRYMPQVHAVLTSLGQPEVDLVLQVRPDAAATELFPGVGPVDDDTVPVLPSAANDRRAGDEGRVSLNPRYTFENFVTGASNRFAQAAALAVAETPARSYNPLFIYGVAGLGKTHLLHAIAHYVKQNYPAYKVRYVSTEAFLNDYVEGIRTNSMPEFKRKYREIDVLLVDDIQFMEGKEGLQEEFFHTFNQLHAANRQIVLSSDRPPRAIATLEDRLRSRFEWGLITDIQPPEFETRLAILRKKAESERLDGIPDGVLAFIAENIVDNVRELEGSLIRVAAYSSLNRVPLTEEVARKILSDLLPSSRPRVITPQLILDETAKMFGFTVDELCGKSRRRPLVTARQISMYVFRELTDYSYPKIAEEFGGRDHTTVMHACDKIRAQMAERRVVFDQVNDLISRIKHGANAGG